jgi:chorismate-pyruvate lyase
MFEVRRILLGCVTMLLSLSAAADASTPVKPLTWSDSFITRLEALALLQSLNAELLSNNSATLTLEHWCDVHHLASPARILAERVRDTDKPVSTEQRKELGVTPTEPVRYRRVQLRCGTVVLSTADNWYVPGRLTPEMNAVLDTTDTPFGKAVQALHFQRHTLSSKILWWPLPVGWEMNSNGVKDGWAISPMPTKLLEHKAVLTLPDGTPLSEVVETYTDNILGFPVPRAQRASGKRPD